MFIFVKSRKCGRQRDVSAVEGEQGSGQGVREYHQVSQFYGNPGNKDVTLSG